MRAAGGLGKRTYKKRNEMVSELLWTHRLRHRHLREGDVLVLCTDGVHDNFTLTRMQAIVANDADPRRCHKRWPTRR